MESRLIALCISQPIHNLGMVLRVLLLVVLHRWFDSEPLSNLLSLLAAFDFPYVLGQVKCQSMSVCVASVPAALLKYNCGMGDTYILMHIKHLAFCECAIK